MTKNSRPSDLFFESTTTHDTVDMAPRLEVRLLSTNVLAPSRANTGSRGDAGYDLYADLTDTNTNVTLEPLQRRLVPTGIAVQIPENHVGLICPRSGLAHKHGISVVNAPGIIDAGYQGEVKVNLVNLGNESYEIKNSDRIAQLVLVPVTTPDVTIVEEFTTETTRGTDGHGSTGK